ncbi:MAG: hypothetical protein H0U44_11780 [Flavisolibacter sp.]|jgi:hypothetical protein|nr:hypothetical protein [Flavisolibacter sp.]
MRTFKFIICCALASMLLPSAQSKGLLKKIKQKAEQTADKLADKKIEEATGTGNQNSTTADASVPGKAPRAKAGNKTANMTRDHVAGSTGFFGVVINRQYGTVDSTNITIDIIGNSPFLEAINSLLTLPMMSGGDQKVIKINGYKALLSKVSGDNETTSYEIQLPINNSLISFKAPGYTQEQLLKLANTLPVAEMAKMLQ